MLVSSNAFNGERLQLAREFRNLTQRELAAQVEASPTLISFCESGKREPSHDLAQACAEVMKFKTEFFYHPIEDEFREPECSFRHRRSTPERLKTMVRAHGTLIGMAVDRLRTHLEFPPLNMPSFPATTGEEIERAAEQTRLYWNLGVDAPIVQVGRVMEHAGVIIVPHTVNSKVDAFSRAGRTSVIFLNRTVQSSSRWNFDIAHECGHLVMHSGIETGSPETECAADRFASAFLMPRTAFSRDFRTQPFSWSHVFDLKRRWRASAAAIVRRAFDLGLLSAVTYRRAYKYMSAQKWRSMGEPYEPSFQEPELLASAISSLDGSVALTLSQLCSELMFTPETFKDVTGFDVPEQTTTGQLVSFA